MSHSKFKYHFKIFLFCCWISTIICTDFHLQKSVKLNAINNVVKINALVNDTIAIQSSADATATITILKGSSYENKISEFSSNVDQSQIQITQNGVFINDGTSLVQKAFTEENFTFSEFVSKGNMIVTSKYILIVSKDTNQPALTKINFDTMKLQEVTYEPVDGWNSSTPSYMRDMGNGNILFGMGYVMFIVDNETLKINQIIPKSLNSHQVLYISSFVDKKTNADMILFSRNTVSDEMAKYTVLQRDVKTQQYIQTDSFYTQSMGPNIYPTSLNNGVGISYGYQVYYWGNFNSVLSISYDEKDVITYRNAVAVSYDQTFIVMRNSVGTYEFYNVSQNFEIKLIKSIYVSKDQLIKGLQTNDDHFLFISTQDMTNKKNNIVKIDIGNTTSEGIKDSDGNYDNQIDFHLFDVEYNQILTLADKGKGAIKIQLRKLDDLAILDQFDLDSSFFGFDQKDVKLISSISWELKFAVAAQNKMAAEGNNDSTVFLFDIKQNKIQYLNISTPGNYTTLRACSRYLINYLAQFSIFTLQNFDDFIIAKTINTTDVELGFYIQKNSLILSSRFNSSKIIYDLDKSLQSPGMFYLSHYMFRHEYANQFFFTGKQIFLQITKQYKRDFSTRAFYNVQPPMLSKITVIEDSQSPYHSARYYLNNLDDGTSCNWIFYIQYDHQEFDQQVWYFTPSLVRYSECDKKLNKVPLESKTKLSFSKIFISSDNKYIIIGLKNNITTQFFIEVRTIADLTKIIASRKFGITKDTDYYDLLDMDFVQNSRLIIHEQQKITIIDAQHQSSASSLGVSSISAFDANKNNFIASAGPSIMDPTKTKITITKAQTIIYEFYLQDTITKIRLSASGDNLAVLTEDQNIFAWSISTLDLLYAYKIIGARKIKFIQQLKLLIQTASSYEIAALRPPKSQLQQLPSILSAGNYNVEASENGQFLAVITNQVASIYEKDIFLVNYSLPVSSQKIVSASFGPNNGLLLVSDANKVYVLTSRPCPQTYIPINFSCVCPAQRYLIQGVCQQCSFPCSACSGSTSSCTQYQAAFYILIIGGVVVLVGLVVAAFAYYRRKKMRSETDDSSLLNHDDRENSKSLKSIKENGND